MCTFFDKEKILMWYWNQAAKEKTEWLGTALKPMQLTNEFLRIQSKVHGVAMAGIENAWHIPKNRSHGPRPVCGLQLRFPAFAHQAELRVAGLV